MNIRRPVLGFVTVGLVLIAVILWLTNKKPVNSPPSISTQTNTAQPAATVQNIPASTAFNTNASSATVATNPIISPTQDKGEQMKQGLASLNDVPIVFYGRLEDQFGSPVMGAQIVASARIYNGVQSTVEHLTAMSDGNGMFQINGGKGEGLGIMPKKEGYVLATTSTYFKYSYMYPDHFTPDQGNPTVIKMWKLQGAELLKQINKTFKIPYTGTPIRFDLVAGEIVSAGGDLKIMVNRPDGVISQQHPQNWNIDFEVVDGGYIETSDQEWGVTYAAPESGYQPSGTFGNNNGPDLVDKAFFIQSRNGQIYSKVHVLFGINANPDDFMNITFTGVANTNASRNWETSAPQ
jgi:hypothetical protein